jgi:hypothetical protein
MTHLPECQVTQDLFRTPANGHDFYFPVYPLDTIATYETGTTQNLHGF